MGDFQFIVVYGMIIGMYVVDVGYFWFWQVVVLVDVGQVEIGFVGVDDEVGYCCYFVIGDYVDGFGWGDWVEEVWYVVQVFGDFCFVGEVLFVQFGYFGQFDFVDFMVVMYQYQYELLCFVFVGDQCY